VGNLFRVDMSADHNFDNVASVCFALGTCGLGLVQGSRSKPPHGGANPPAFLSPERLTTISELLARRQRNRKRT